MAMKHLVAGLKDKRTGRYFNEKEQRYEMYFVAAGLPQLVGWIDQAKLALLKNPAIALADAEADIWQKCIENVMSWPEDTAVTLEEADPEFAKEVHDALRRQEEGRT